MYKRQGQGRDAAKQYFRDHPDEADKLETAVRENFHKLMGSQSRVAAKAAGRAVDCLLYTSANVAFPLTELTKENYATIEAAIRKTISSGSNTPVSYTHLVRPSV